LRVVLDTNVVISGLLSPYGAPSRVLSLAFARMFGLLVDDRILAEYQEVLARPKFSFDESHQRAVLNRLSWVSEHVVARPLSVELPDPDDTVFLEVAIEGAADVLVTGNSRHFPGELGVAVETPSQFLGRLAQK
jgi:putative PIN family toxin of toxin-antitoxin system